MLTRIPIASYKLLQYNCIQKSQQSHIIQLIHFLRTLLTTFHHNNQISLSFAENVFGMCQWRY